MVRLQVLGGVSLDVPEGRDAMAVLSHPKRLAVLTYLALEAPGGFLSRDRLLAMFWPEAKETQGRNALNQVLHALRSSLGEGAIVTRGRAEVGVGIESVTCDAVAFLEAVRAGRSETALDLYTGHLLPGFHLTGASEFDAWLSEEQAQLREAAAGVAWTVAHGYLQAGCLVDAERTAQKAMGLVCTDESEVRRFIEALAVAGDRAGAIQFFERFRSLLDRELELEPGPRTQELVQRIRDDPELLLGSEGPPEIESTLPAKKRISGEAEGDRGEESNTPRRGFGWRLLTWALACLAGGWASSQAATLMVARFGWPEPVGQVASLLLVMAAFGFFFALILAFYVGERARGGTVGWELLVVAGAMLVLGLVLSRSGSRGALRSLVESSAVTTSAEAVAPGPVIISLRSGNPAGEIPPSLLLAVRDGLAGPLAEAMGRPTLVRTDLGMDDEWASNPDSPGLDAGTPVLLEVRVRGDGHTTDLIARVLTADGSAVLWEREFIDAFSAEDLPTLRPAVVEALGTELPQVLSTAGL